MGLSIDDRRSNSPSCRKEHGKDGATAGSKDFLPSPTKSAYHNFMAKAKKFDLDPAPVVDDEEDETLAAIDEGIRDADAGRVVPAEKVREMLP